VNFVSFEFWIFFLAGLAGMGCLRWGIVRWAPACISAFDRISLIVLSLSLLYRESATTVVIILYVSSVVWFGTQWAESRKGFHRKLAVALVSGLALAPLIYYKYAVFLLGDVLHLSTDLAYAVLIPAGLSFYTFQLLGFMVDRLARQEHEKWCVTDYANFATFFPQIVAGPIERVRSLLPQLHGFTWRITSERLNTALAWMVYGMFLKLAIADNLASGSGWITAALDNPIQIWLANLIFAYRIYFDFAGYSFMALGLGKLLGIELTVNFRSPYTATNIQDFWRRWHITLSGWFRDYVYMPLGGSRTGSRVPRNILIVFVLSGLWHGAGWNFILWGVYHGILLCLFRMWPRRFYMPTAVSWLICFVVVLGSWLFFYETNIQQLIAKSAILINPLFYTPEAWSGALAHYAGVGNLATLALAMSMALGVHGLEWASHRHAGDHARWFLHPAATVIMVVLTIVLSPTTDNGFIYFNF
jgi:alginate O-acetyltransferase complex protein AlgI